MKIIRSIQFKFATITLGIGVLLIGCQCGNDTSGTETTADEAAITKVLNQQKEAWNRGDVAGYMEGYKNDSSITFVGSAGVTRGYHTILNRYLKHYPNREIMGKLNFTNLEFIPAGDGYCLVIGKFILNRKPEKAEGYFTLLWEKTPYGWRILNDHTS